ncbi:MAG: relaxase/mobilization nuclease domain-containing protein [Pseudomonadales bacterium]
MIVGFSKHGTGDGKGPTEYFTHTQGRENDPPVILRGNPEQTRDLIDSLDFKYKYTSGVLSFAPGEVITPKMEEAIMDRFEQVAFAGLDPDRYNILWVRHSHADHHELHFVTPRVELESGKSLNIKPPGQYAQSVFDDFRSEINSRYGLADPEDPSRIKNVKTPNFELKIIAQALREGETPPENMRKLLDGMLSQRAEAGLINNRQELIEQVTSLGLKIPRAGEKYITVQDPDSGKRWRLKGALYERDFTPGKAIKTTEGNRTRDFSRPDPAASKEYALRVEQHIRDRTRYHEGRYPQHEPALGLELSQESLAVALPDRTEPLARTLHRGLGPDAILHGRDHPDAPQRRDLGEGRRQGAVDLLREKWPEPSLRQSQSKDGALRQQTGHLDDHRGEVNDRTGKTLIERIAEFTRAIQRTVRGIRAVAKSFIENVRDYSARVRSLTPPSRQLAQVIQQEQALTRSRSRDGPSL